MKRRICGILLIGVSIIGLSACKGIAGTSTINGSGKLKTESRSVSGFDSVTLGGIGLLDVQVTGIESLTVSADDNVLPYLKTSVANNRLNITVDSGNNTITPSQPIHYLLTVKSLKDLVVSGAGAANLGPYTTDKLSLGFSGTGTVNIVHLATETFTVKLSGTGTLTVDGTTQSQDVRISGTSAYNARSFQSAQATVDLSGVGNATISVSDTLNATVSGVGNITYYGAPKVTQHISGVGSIKQGS